MLMLILSWILAMLMIPFWFFINYLYLQIAPEEFKIKDKYVGVVVTTTNLARYKYLFIYGSGIFLLIEYLKRKNQPFKLLKKFDKKKFDDMIYDENCRGLYILGHGSRHGLSISKDEMLYYCEYANAPKKAKKVFIIQLHCNHLKGKPLAEYLDACTDFSMETIRTIEDNKNYFIDKLREELDIDIFDIFRGYIFEVIGNIKERKSI